MASIVHPRPLTSGPHYHWFGYYDKHQFDPTGRYMLRMGSTFVMAHNVSYESPLVRNLSPTQTTFPPLDMDRTDPAA